MPNNMLMVLLQLLQLFDIIVTAVQLSWDVNLLRTMFHALSATDAVAGLT